MNFAGETKHTTNPIYVGSSVIGMKYKDGLVIASDTRINYGSLSKFFHVNTRVQQVNANTLLGSAGEYSDFQEVTRILREVALDDILDNRSFLGPKEITNYLSSIHYYKRNKMNPYWNSTIIGGINWDSSPVLYSIDQFGTLLTGDWMLVGMAQYFCNAVITPYYPEDYRQLTRERAVELIEQCFRVLFYRDTRAGNNVKFGFMEFRNGVPVYEESEKVIQSEWNHKGFLMQANEKIYLEN
jgi:20S proteasome subunit beta 7